MLNGVSIRCCCLFECECDKLERLILDWTSPGALEIVKSRLFSFTDPTEIFARLACVLFYREIRNGTAVTCTKDNLRKADIAFRYAYTFANELDDCITFYSSCWKKFQDLVARLEVGLRHFSSASRRRMPLKVLIEEMLPELEVSYSVPLCADETGTESAGAGPTVCSTDKAVVSQMTSTGAPVKMEIADNQDEAQLGNNQTSVTAVRKSTVVRKSSNDRSDVDGQPQRKRAKLSTSVERPDDVSGDESNGEVDGSSEESENREVEEEQDEEQEPEEEQEEDLDEGENDSSSLGQRWMYQCNIASCGRRFKHDFLLPRHVRLHHGGTLCGFPCDDCGLDFDSKKTILSHKKVHDQNRRLMCSYCDYRFKSPKSLYCHEKRYHLANKWVSSTAN